MSFETYDKKTGEPVAIQPKIWNGELMEYQRSLLNKLYKIKDQKEIKKTILELIKSTYHVENEMYKATFYKEEFDSFCSFLDNNELLSIDKETQEFTDELGKVHNHVIGEKRSLVKSIPQVRAKIKG